MANAKVRELSRVYGEATDAFSSRAVAELAVLWGTLDFADYEAVRVSLYAAYPVLAAKYGLGAVHLTALTYTAMRRAQGITSDFRMPTPLLREVEKLEKHVDYAIGSLYNHRDVDRAFSNLSGDLVKYSMDQARHEMGECMKEDERQNGIKPLWSIIPEAGACAYCQKLGGSFRYHSGETAQATFHSNCRCDVVPEFEPPTES